MGASSVTNPPTSSELSLWRWSRSTGLGLYLAGVNALRAHGEQCSQRLPAAQDAENAEAQMSASTSETTPGVIRIGLVQYETNGTLKSVPALPSLGRAIQTTARPTRIAAGSANAWASHVSLWTTWSHVRAATPLATAGLITVGLRLWSETYEGQAIVSRSLAADNCHTGHPSEGEATRDGY